MQLIPPSNGGYAKVSDEDFEYLSRWKWCRFEKDGTIASSETSRYGHITIYMSILVAVRMGLNVDKFDIDHRDRIRSNNQRENLREATRSQNNMNKGVRSDNTSGFKGVNYCKRQCKWVSRIGYGGKRMHIGYFDTPEEAAKAYDRAAKDLHGEFAFLNFPPAKREGKKEEI